MTTTARTAPTELAPIGVDERVELIDILRGFALLGILTVNFWGWSSESARGLDKIVSLVLDIAVSSSFYPLFSFLFGLGFAVQFLRARERGAGVSALYLRRMLALFLIGAFHAIVIWSGDILVSYSVIGILLMLLHRLSDRWLLTIAAVVLIAGLWPQGVAERLRGASAAESTMLREVAAFENARAIQARAERFDLDPSATRMDAFTASISSRWRWFQSTVRRLLSANTLTLDLPAFFLIGFVVGRRRILQEASRHRRGLTAAAIIGFGAALSGTIVVYVVKPSSQFWNTLAWDFSDLGPTLFYVSAISLGVTFVPAFARAFQRFAAAGRVGLTNYLLQSISMTVLFSRYGASLTKPSTALWLAIDLVFFFGVQIPVSRWWIQRFRFGPAEWVWRSVTYGSPQPMRLQPLALRDLIGAEESAS